MVSFTDINNISNEEINNLRGLVSLIKQPLISNKTTRLFEENKYTFLVDRRINKTNLKTILEFAFNVSITNVNTCMMPEKKRTVGRYRGKRSRYKKVIITLKEGDRINLFSNT